MISTRNGHEIFSCSGRCYSAVVGPAIDPTDIGINSVLSVLELRDVRPACAEYEVAGREIILRLPTAQRKDHSR